LERHQEAKRLQEARRSLEELVTYSYDTLSGIEQVVIPFISRTSADTDLLETSLKLCLTLRNLRKGLPNYSQKLNELIRTALSLSEVGPSTISQDSAEKALELGYSSGEGVE
jgi:hypothetical protein